MLVRRLAVAATALAVCLACGEPTADADAPAYAPAYALGGRPVLYHWHPGATVRVYADAGNAIDAYALAGALDTAFAAWRSDVQFREFTLVRVASLADADVVVHFRDRAFAVTFADCTYPTMNGAGLTFFCPDAALDAVQTLPPVGAPAAGHVRMDVSVARLPDPAQFRSVVTHEIGHVLGIGAHSGDPSDLMYPFPSVAAPSARDAATLRYVLHQPSALLL